MKARPSFQFYPSDWLRDPGLRSCSLAARGLWIDMLAFMHEAEPYGHLRLHGRDISPDILARMVGSSLKVIRRLLAELESAGVFSKAVAGTLFSRRMVRDQELRERRGQYGYLSEKHPDVPKKKDGEKDTSKDTLPLSIGASIGGSPSSSSSSSLNSYRERKGARNELNGHGPSFEAFWKAYPRKEGKGACRRWWIDHKPDDVLLGIMFSKIEQAKQTPKWNERGGKFIPMPATWLNQERWDDEYRAASQRKEPLPL